MYSVFNPAKLGEVTNLMAKYTDHVSLICAVTHKYLEYDAASALTTTLVADLRSGARTEKDWHVDLELANRSLDQAILQLDTDAKDTPNNPAGDQTAQMADQAQPADMTWTTRLRLAMVVAAAAPTARSCATGPDRLRPTGRKESPRAGEKASAPLPGRQVRRHTRCRTLQSVEHAEFRHDLASLGENPNEPPWLTDDYLDQVVAGHKKHGDAAFKQWLHPAGRHAGGPPVRVSFRAYPGNSWDKVPEALRRYTKFTAVQCRNSSTWDWREVDEAPSNWVYFGDRESQRPRCVLIFLVPPIGGSAYYVGGELPDLYASELKVMRKDQGKLFEDSSRNLSTHDDLLMQALGLPSVTTPGEAPTVFVLANAEFQLANRHRPGSSPCPRTQKKVSCLTVWAVCVGSFGLKTV